MPLYGSLTVGGYSFSQLDFLKSLSYCLGSCGYPRQLNSSTRELRVDQEIDEDQAIAISSTGLNEGIMTMETMMMEVNLGATFGGIYYSNRKNTLVTSDGTIVKLRRQSLEVFRFLAENRNCLKTKDEIIGEIWGQTIVTDDSLVQCISDIRKLLGEEYRKSLLTFPRRGYMLQSDDAR